MEGKRQCHFKSETIFADRMTEGVVILDTGHHLTGVSKCGTENGMKGNTCKHILAYYIYTLSLYKSPLFRSDDVDVLYIHHKVVKAFSRVNEIAWVFDN